MGVGSGLYMYDVVVKRSRSLSHLLMISCLVLTTLLVAEFLVVTARVESPIGYTIVHFQKQELIRR